LSANFPLYCIVLYCIGLYLSTPDSGLTGTYSMLADGRSCS